MFSFLLAYWVFAHKRLYILYNWILSFSDPQPLKKLKQLIISTTSLTPLDSAAPSVVQSDPSPVQGCAPDSDPVLDEPRPEETPEAEDVTVSESVDGQSQEASGDKTESEVSRCET